MAVLSVSWFTSALLAGPDSVFYAYNNFLSAAFAIAAAVWFVKWRASRKKTDK
jgi:hypothetical protein